ncbi:Mannan endo-1 [Psidium guajava]|nr:Mannan endo-1 [Psidium guajava]
MHSSRFVWHRTTPCGSSSTTSSSRFWRRGPPPQEMISRRLTSRTSFLGSLRQHLHRAFGNDPGCLNVDLPDVLFARAFEEATELTLLRFLVPPFVWKPLRFLSLGHEKRLKEAVRIVHKFADETVSDRRMELSKLGSLSHRSDLLSRFIEDKNHFFSNKFLRDFCVNFILAGRDTSSVALVWFFWLIYKHPEVEAKGPQ